MPKVEKLTVHQVRDRCRQFNVELLSENYTNSKEKLLFRCLTCHEDRLISWSHLALGKLCKSCYHDSRLLKSENIASLYASERYKVLNPEAYTGQHFKLRIECPVGHVFEGTVSHWKAGKRCPQCRVWKRSLKEIASALSAEQYQLTQTEYLHNKLPLQIICPANHATTIWWGNWLKGHRCQECFKTKLIALPEVLEDLQQRGLTMTEKSQLEYENAHTSVTLHCDKGHSFPTRYSYIRNGSGCTVCALSANSSKVLCLTQPDTRLKEFFDQNHLQRSTHYSLCAALEYEGQIVGALSLGRPSRAHVTVGWEIKRLAFERGTTVVGGTERLWQTCLDQLPPGIDEIISFCDRRYSKGGIYARLGMILRRETGATPHIVDKWKRLRYQTFAGKPQELSKYGLIYDCGHQRWEWHRAA